MKNRAIEPEEEADEMEVKGMRRVEDFQKEGLQVTDLTCVSRYASK